MAPSSARRHSNWLKWLVSLIVIVVVWRIGMYGVDWKSPTSVAVLLIAIAVLAFSITFWKRKN